MGLISRVSSRTYRSFDTKRLQNTMTDTSNSGPTGPAGSMLLDTTSIIMCAVIIGLAIIVTITVCYKTRLISKRQDMVNKLQNIVNQRQQYQDLINNQSEDSSGGNIAIVHGERKAL